MSDDTVFINNIPLFKITPTRPRADELKFNISSKSCDISSFSKAFTNFNTLRPRPNGRRFTDDTIKISLKFVPKGPINNIPALV